MSVKYGKQILAKKTVNINNEEYTCYVLDDDDYYNIHIVDEHYHDDEMNTLKLQEPKEYITLEEVTGKAFMLSRIMEHYLWHITYGDNNKHYTFDIDYILDEI